MNKYTKKIKQLLLLIGKSKWIYIGSLAAIAAEVAAESAGNLIIRHIIDRVILENRGMALIIIFTFIFGGISLSRALFSFLEGKGKARVSETVAKNIRNQMYDHIQHLSFQYHDKAQTGELVQRATSDVNPIYSPELLKKILNTETRKHPLKKLLMLQKPLSHII